jgi:uncharacterized delta-60 repeat protein
MTFLQRLGMLGTLVVIISATGPARAAYPGTMTQLAADGELDPTFGVGGKVVTDLLDGELDDLDELTDAALQRDGKIVVCGYVYNGTSSATGVILRKFALLRYNSDGSVDETFGNNGKVFTVVAGDSLAQATAVAVQPDGKIVTAGTVHYSHYLSATGYALTRHNPDGSLDTSFAVNGIFLREFSQVFINDVALDGDRIVAAGRANRATSDFAVVRLNPDGSVDTSFSGDGVAFTDFVGGEDRAFAVAVQSDGKIVAAGERFLNNKLVFAAARYNPDGTADTSFDTNGRTFTEFNFDSAARAVAIQGDGRIVMAGYVAADLDDNSLNTDFALVRLDTDGRLDATFGPNQNGRAFTNFGTPGDRALGVALQSDGRIVAGGASNTGLAQDYALARYTSDGLLDTTFSEDGRVTTDFAGANDRARTVLIQSDGKIIAAGNAVQPGGGSNDFSLARYDASGGTLDVVVTDDTSQTFLDGLTSVGGNLHIIDTALTSIVLPGLTSVGGAVDINGNSATTTIDLGNLETVGGTVDVNGNSASTTIDLGSLETVSGSVAVSTNTSVTSIDLGNLQTVGGDVAVSGNTSATSIDFSQLTVVGGDVNVSGNSSATSVDFSSLETAGGDVNVSGNGSCTTVLFPELDSVSGNLTVESCGTGTFSLTGTSTGGSLLAWTTGYDTMTGMTAAGSTTLSNATSQAVMTVQLEAETFTSPVSFSVARLDAAALPTEDGVDSAGEPVIVDPVVAYQITFGVPTLNRDATLTFEVNVAALDDATRTAFLAALETGGVTLATSQDGSTYQTFPLCADGAEATAGGCVLVQAWDANGQPTTEAPAIVRFSNVVGHFSIWAVAIVTGPPAGLATTTTAILSDAPDSSLVGAPVLVQWSVTAGSATGTPTGTVTVSDGVDSCSAPVGSGSCTVTLTTAGARTLTATYTGDTNFQGSSGTAAHTVSYDFAGFFTPVANSPVVNDARAGQAVPLKWEIRDAAGLGILDPGSFMGVTSYETDCSAVSGPSTTVVEEPTAGGTTGLVSLGEGRWQFDWKTTKAYSGQCRVLLLSLKGSTHEALFKFR